MHVEYPRDLASGTGGDIHRSCIGEFLGEEMDFRFGRRGRDAAAERRVMPEEILIVNDDADFLDDFLAAWHLSRFVAVAYSGRSSKISFVLPL